MWIVEASRPPPPPLPLIILVAMATMPSPFHHVLSLRLPRPNPRGIGNPPPPQALAGGATSLEAKADLLALIADQDRGLRTQSDPAKRAQIVAAISALGELGNGQVTTGPSLSGTWRMLWTTEKEQLFIIKNAYLFGTRTGDVLQVIDVGNGSLNNVITFPPSGVFFVRSSIEVASPQRVNFA